MVVVDARVHHGDLDTLTREPELVLGNVCTRHRQGGREIGRHLGRDRNPVRLDRVDGLDGVELPDLRDRTRLRFDRDTVPQRLELHPLLVGGAFGRRLLAELGAVGSDRRGTRTVGKRRRRELDEPVLR